MVEIHPLRLHQHPVDARDGDANPRRVIADLLTVCGGNFGDVIGDGEGRYLDGVVTRLAGVAHRVLQLPVFENLVADPELHGREGQVCGAEVQACGGKSTWVAAPTFPCATGVERRPAPVTL